MSIITGGGGFIMRSDPTSGAIPSADCYPSSRYPTDGYMDGGQ